MPTGATAAPTFDAENIYVPREYGVSCISKRTRSVRWSQRVDARCPAIPCDDLLVIPSYSIIGLSVRDGSVRWHLPGSINTYRATLRDGVFYSSHQARQEDRSSPVPYFVALDPRSGELIWRASFPADIRGGALVTSQSVYLTCWDGYLYRLNRADGRLVWRHDIGAKESIIIPKLEGNRLYVCANGKLLCIADGP